MLYSLCWDESELALFDLVWIIFKIIPSKSLYLNRECQLGYLTVLKPYDIVNIGLNWRGFPTVTLTSSIPIKYHTIAVLL